MSPERKSQIKTHCWRPARRNWIDQPPGAYRVRFWSKSRIPLNPSKGFRSIAVSLLRRHILTVVFASLFAAPASLGPPPMQGNLLLPLRRRRSLLRAWSPVRRTKRSFLHAVPRTGRRLWLDGNLSYGGKPLPSTLQFLKLAELNCRSGIIWPSPIVSAIASIMRRKRDCNS
jgi:hypothetical protein